MTWNIYSLFYLPLLHPRIAHQPKGSLPSSRTTPSNALLKLAATSLSSLTLTFSHWKVLPKITNQFSFSPLSFPNCLRKPETVIPIPTGDCSLSPTKPSWNHVLHQLATQLSHIAKCGYSPHSEINSLLCQEKKPICPVNLQGHSYLQKTPIIRKLSCNVICNPSESPRLICIARDLLIHIGQGTCSLGTGSIYMAFQFNIYGFPSDYPKHTIIKFHQVARALNEPISASTGNIREAGSIPG